MFFDSDYTKKLTGREFYKLALERATKAAEKWNHGLKLTDNHDARTAASILDGFLFNEVNYGEWFQVIVPLQVLEGKA